MRERERDGHIDRRRHRERYEIERWRERYVRDGHNEMERERYRERYRELEMVRKRWTEREGEIGRDISIQSKLASGRVAQWLKI